MSVKNSLTDDREQNLTTVASQEEPTETELLKGQNKPGINLEDGTVYAYEYARVLWSGDKPGNIADLLVDYPRNWWQLSGDSRNHTYGNVTDIPPVIP